MGGWPIRYRENCWQVRITEGVGDSKWIRCESDGDAYAMSASLELMLDATEGNRIGEEIAAELESSAVLFARYGCNATAQCIMEHAKYVRGLPSQLDGISLD